jgi:hypothetical protein
VDSELRREIDATAKRYTVIDADGQVVQGVAVVEKWKPPRPPTTSKHRNFDEDWTVVFLAELKTVALDPDLDGADLRVLTFLISELGFENEFKNLNQAEVARQLGMLRQNVNRSIRRLAAKDILVQGLRVGRGHLYSLNPRFGWRGDGIKHKAAKKAAPPLRERHLRSVDDLQREREREDERANIEAGAPLLPGIEA